MRDPFQTTNDLDRAGSWFVNEYLSRRQPCGRVLSSTKLSDLIFDGFDTINMSQSPIRALPINVVDLVRDIFTALFSPVIKHQDAGAVNARERLYNKPILDAVIQDDRFETLKNLCLNKELVSFEAATAFGDSLKQALSVVSLPQSDSVHLIDMLKRHAQQTVQDIRTQTANGGKPERLLKLYNRLYRKLSQIEQLEKKAERESLFYQREIGHCINQAIESAVECAVTTNSIMTAWGTEGGDAKRISENRKLLEHVQNSRELMEIARMLGRYREIIANKRKNSFSYGLGEKYDLTNGNDITNCLSSELALLGSPATEILFFQKYQQKRLLQYRKRVPIVKGKGDMIVLVDESGSTQSVAAWAKAFALAMLDIATKDKRKFALVHFASSDDVKVDLFEPGHYRSEDMMAAAEHFFGGGTDFEAPLREAINLLESGYENADITIITDGECELPEEFQEELRDKLKQHNASVTGILLDKEDPCGESLEPFCDTIYHSKDIIEDEIAVEILNGKVS